MQIIEKLRENPRRQSWDEADRRQARSCASSAEPGLTGTPRCGSIRQHLNKTHRLAVPPGRPVGKTYAVCCFHGAPDCRILRPGQPNGCDGTPLGVIPSPGWQASLFLPWGITESHAWGEASLCRVSASCHGKPPQRTKNPMALAVWSVKVTRQSRPQTRGEGGERLTGVDAHAGQLIGRTRVL